MKKKPSITSADMRPDVRQIDNPISEHFQGKAITPESVLWPNSEDLVQRFHALLSGIDWSNYSASSRLKLLDLGCGPGFLLDYLEMAGILDLIDYTGTDLSPEILKAAQKRWPNQNLSASRHSGRTLSRSKF